MDILTAGLPHWAFWTACAVTFFAGFVKGTIGFAMPLIMVSAFGSFMAPELALAALILPVLTTNIHQSLRQGWAEARATAWAYRRSFAMICLGIALSAPFVLIMPQRLLLALLGVPILAFAIAQLRGAVLRLRLEHRTRAEYGLGLVGGLYGGMSGIWGPPLLVYLLSTGAPKLEIVRVQGIAFFLGALMLLAAHLGTGVLDSRTLPLSAALVVPAGLGMLAGFRLQDRLDADRFRRLTLMLLVLTALNLIRMAAGF